MCSESQPPPQKKKKKNKLKQNWNGHTFEERHHDWVGLLFLKLDVFIKNLVALEFPYRRGSHFNRKLLKAPPEAVVVDQTLKELKISQDSVGITISFFFFSLSFLLLLPFFFVVVVVKNSSLWDYNSNSVARLSNLEKKEGDKCNSKIVNIAFL